MKFLLRGLLGALVFLFISITPLSAQSDYRLALGSFLRQDLARDLTRDLEKAGIASETRAVNVKGRLFYRVFSQKSFSTVQEARQELRTWEVQRISPQIDYKSAWVLDMKKDFPTETIPADTASADTIPVDTTPVDTTAGDKKPEPDKAEFPKPGPEPARPEEEGGAVEVLIPETEPGVEALPEAEAEVEIEAETEVEAQPEPEPEPEVTPETEPGVEAETGIESESASDSELVKQIRALILEGSTELVKSWVLESSALYGYDFIVEVLESEVEREPSSPAIEALYFAYLERQKSRGASD